MPPHSNPNFSPVELAGEHAYPALDILAERGVQVEIDPGDQTTLITATVHGLPRQMTVPAAHEVRLIVDPAAVSAVTGRPDDTDPLLAVVESQRQIGVSRLCEPPKGLSTERFLSPKQPDSVVATEDLVGAVEEAAHQKLDDHDGFQRIVFSDTEARPPECMAVDGYGYFVRRHDDGTLEWFTPKVLKLPRIPLRDLLQRQGRNTPDVSQQVTEALSEAPVLVEAQTGPENEDTPAIDEILGSPNESIAAFSRAIYQQQLAKLQANPRNSDNSNAALALMAATTAERIQRRALREIGLSRINGVPFDFFARSFLPEARARTQAWDKPELATYIREEFRGERLQSKHIADTPEAVQREEAAWALAKQRAEKELINLAQDATLAELEAAIQPTAQKQEKVTLGTPPQVINGRGERLPASVYFAEGGLSPLTLEQWCGLPIRPILIAPGKPERGSQGLAEFLFENILYSRQVCDRSGVQQVGLSSEKRQEYIDKVKFAIEQGTPLIASEYIPFIAIGNPIKRNTQQASLAEVDFLRRLVEISRAVELYYSPGMHWLIGNEAPAFQGPEFSLSSDYVERFHYDVGAMVRMIDPTGQNLSMFNMKEVLSGTPEHAAEWERYQVERGAELREAYHDPSHPHHQEVMAYLNTYVYAMATCTDPFQFEAAQGLSTSEIANVYAALKEITGSIVRGLGASTEPVSVEALSPQQQELLTTLRAWGVDMTFKYRVAMDSRDALPAFQDVIPDHTLAHTIVTKKDKLVLYPNSGKGAYFPAHGEPILLPSPTANKSTVVTIRPWWHVASRPDRYQPMYLPGGTEPFYFVEK